MGKTGQGGRVAGRTLCRRRYDGTKREGVQACGREWSGCGGGGGSYIIRSRPHGSGGDSFGGAEYHTIRQKGRMGESGRRQVLGRHQPGASGPFPSCSISRGLIMTAGRLTREAPRVLCHISVRGGGGGGAAAARQRRCGGGGARGQQREGGEEGGSAQKSSRGPVCRKCAVGSRGQHICRE